MTPTPLSEWADREGLPRRTAYNWAKSGKLNVPLRKTLTGRYLVLDDDNPADADAHPFVVAYAEALRLPVGTHTRDMYHSPILEFWGVDLYNVVEPDLRPLVLNLALAAACGRPKRDALWRLTDWLGRIELARWYAEAGFVEAAAMVGVRPEITDSETFFDWWPTGVGSFEWRNELEEAVERHLEATSTKHVHGGQAADTLAENGLVGLDELPLAGRRETFRHGLDRVARTRHDEHNIDVHGPDKGDLWDIRAFYSDVMWALARPATRSTAYAICELVGQDPDAPSPAEPSPLYEIGYPVVKAAAVDALTPYVHAAHIREVQAFRLIALGKPFPTAPTTT